MDLIFIEICIDLLCFYFIITIVLYSLYSFYEDWVKPMKDCVMTIGCYC